MTSATGGPPTTGQFHEISRARCEELLASRTVGRVAWNSPDGPQLLPVTYAMVKDQVVFRTSPYGVLSQLVRPCQVVFEVDELDHSAATWMERPGPRHRPRRRRLAGTGRPVGRGRPRSLGRRYTEPVHHDCPPNHQRANRRRPQPPLADPVLLDRIPAPAVRPGAAVAQ